MGGFLWDRAGASVCKPWSFRQGQVYTSVSLLRYHGQKLAFAPEWEPANQTRNLPSHNQWNMYFESDDGARRPLPIRPVPIRHSTPVCMCMCMCMCACLRLRLRLRLCGCLFASLRVSACVCVGAARSSLGV